jgi:hypothetical protein
MSQLLELGNARAVFGGRSAAPSDVEREEAALNGAAAAGKGKTASSSSGGGKEEKAKSDDSNREDPIERVEEATLSKDLMYRTVLTEGQQTNSETCLVDILDV